MSHYDDDEEEAYSSGVLLQAELDRRPDVHEEHERVIGELCHTAEETGILDFRMDAETAMLIWKIVELAKTLDEETAQPFKM